MNNGDVRTTAAHPSNESVIQPMDAADSMFTYAPVSLWEEDFSEVKRRLDQLKRSGVEDLRKHFKKNPEEVLAIARMVRIIRVNHETLALYDAAGPVEFHEGLSQIFNKESFEAFKEELIALWKGRTSFTSEAINLTLSGTSKNILMQMRIPPDFLQTWSKVYVAITDITVIKDRIKNLVASEMKYRNIFDESQTPLLIVDLPSGVIIEANKSAKRLLAASNSELVGLHLADLVQKEEKELVRNLLRLQPDRANSAGQSIQIRGKNNGTIPVHVTSHIIEGDYANIIVVSLIPADERIPAKPADRKMGTYHTGLDKKLTQRERQIVRLICSGKTSRAIAQHLSISDKTVETHRARIMQKLEKHCVADLVKFAITNGLARMQ